MENKEKSVSDPKGLKWCDVSCRRLTFTFFFLCITCIGIILFTDYLWRSDLYGLKYGLLALFILLHTQLSFSFCTIIAGFLSRRFSFVRNPEIRLSSIDPESVENIPPTAILFPIYNEDVKRVFASIKLTLESLKDEGKEDAFDFFILSDTRDPEIWMQEEAAWLELLNEYEGHGRIYYRHRVNNSQQKSGNISDFLENWGDHYRYMIIFDADSIMSARSLIQMVAHMEENPKMGLLQSAPAIVKSETLFGRMQQFSNRVYGPLFVTGLNFWQQSAGNYWGHNAIIRTAAFVDNCALPNLPWRAPMGGHILSHDFVESALLAKAGYEVWLATDEDATFEEAPQTLSESSKRDRRWCQGNLQHGWLLFAKEFMWMNKLHFLNGIFGYLGSFLWFWMLIFSTLIVIQFEQSGLTFLPTTGFMRFFNLGVEAHGFLILGMTLSMVFSVKALTLLDACFDHHKRKQFSGFLSLAAGIFLETLLSMLLAPLNMIWHTWFVISIPLGQSIGWGSQQRNSAGMITLMEAIQLHGVQTVIGILWTWVAYSYGGTFVWWLLPVLFPLIFSIPIGMLFTSRKASQILSKIGIWRFPEEQASESVVSKLDHHISTRLSSFDSDISNVEHCLLDPYANSLHVVLQRRREKIENVEAPSDLILNQIITEGVKSLSQDQIHTVLNHSDTVYRLHKCIWETPENLLHDSWTKQMNRLIHNHG